MLANDIGAVNSNWRPTTSTKPSLRHLHRITSRIPKIIENTVRNDSRFSIIPWTLLSIDILSTVILLRLIVIDTSLLPLILIPPPFFFETLPT